MSDWNRFNRQFVETNSERKARLRASYRAQLTAPPLTVTALAARKETTEMSDGNPTITIRICQETATFLLAAVNEIAMTALEGIRSEPEAASLALRVATELKPQLEGKGHPDRPALPDEEVGWLIEREPSPAGPSYWTPKPRMLRVEPWTWDNLEAVRFARKEDAERVIQTLPGGPYHAVEHAWG